MPQKKETDKAGDIRRSQMVQIYGPGAIVNLRYNNVTISTVMADLHMWEYKKTANNEKTRDQKFTDARLSKRINAEIKYKKLYEPATHIKQFWLPPVVPDDLENKETRKPHLQSKIFPETLICPECRRVDYISSNYWGRLDYDVRRYCLRCSDYKRKKVYLVPSRFITCCEAGHLQEFNYRSWLEFRTGKQDKCKHQNIFLNQRAGLGLASLILSCGDCKAFTSMDGVFNQDVFKGVPCDGNKPWLVDSRDDDKKELCELQPRVVQRNSNSVWRGETVSALTIPPWDEVLANQLGEDWVRINHFSEPEARKNYITNNYNFIKTKINLSLDELIEKIEQEIAKNETASSDLKYDEYKALTRFDEHKRMKDFQVRKQAISPKIGKLLSLVISVERIREVRALVAFSRISDSKKPEEKILVPLTDKTNQDWLPAIEVFGEGVFVELERDLLTSYLGSEYVITDLAKLYPKKQLEPEVVKKIFFHTFSHLFMRAIAVEAGYALASLRERIYDGDDQFGILVYTSTSDSEGTLGGLSRLAKTSRMESIIKNSLTYSMICSNDPLCHQGSLSEHEDSNGSACHTCLLVPETSCEYFNSHLSRTLVEGIVEQTELF